MTEKSRIITRYRAEVEYVGTGFAGWQVQPRERTVQGVFHDTLKSVFGEPIRLPRAAGRTDAGVHSLGMTVDFDIPARLAASRLRYVLNRVLPDDISVRRLAPVHPEFNALRDACARTYEYRFFQEGYISAFDKDRYYHLTRKYSLRQLNTFAEIFRGNHNFRAVSVTGTPAKSYQRTVSVCRFYSREYGMVFRIQADGFLRKMVRMIISSILMMADGKLERGEMLEMLRSGRRTIQIVPVPARGLYFVRAKYR